MKRGGPDRARRRLLFALAAALPGLPARAETALPRPPSLPAAARAATARGDALVVLVSLPRCPYCERVRQSYLLLLAAEGAPVVQLDVGSRSEVVDFDGVSRSHEAVVRAWGARLAPTLLFLDARGQEVAERLVGAGIPDFYGALLEQRRQTARERLKTR